MEANKKQIAFQITCYVPDIVLETLVCILHYVAWENEVICPQRNNLEKKSKKVGGISNPYRCYCSKMKIPQPGHDRVLHKL